MTPAGHIQIGTGPSYGVWHTDTVLISLEELFVTGEAAP
jgi:hypothetical protein